MGVMGVFKWLRKDIVQRDRNRRSLTPKINVLNNEAYRNALQAFIDRRRNSNESVGCITTPNSPDKERHDFIMRTSYENEKKKRNNDNREDNKIGIAGVPSVEASEIFEIGWIAGTEDRYMELMFAEWQSTRVSLRRHTHPDCRDAIKADLEVLTEIRHPNVLLLMATTHTDDHGLVAIFEPVDCTLYNFVHEQGERVSVQGIAKCAGNLAGALQHAHMRGYVHGAVSPHCIFLATCGTVKLGGWELASSLNGPNTMRKFDQRLRYEIYKWQAPEIFKRQEISTATDVYGLALVIWEMCTMNIPWNGLSKSEVETQYVRWEQGVVTDLYNFPPLLNKLLDAGLQLDVSKRTLDMSRMRRFLQTLEIQYEDKDAIYVEASTNNNNNPPKLVLNATPECNLTSDSSPIQKYTPAQTPKRYSERKTNESKSHVPRTLNLNLVEEADKWKEHDCLSFGQSETAPVEIIQHVVKPTSVRKVNVRNVSKANSNEKLSKIVKQRPKLIESQRKSHRELIPDDRSFAHTSDSTDDESSGNDLRMDIKKLRQTLDSRRKDFFYGNDSASQTENEITADDQKTRILTQVRSKDYEPHKPASHKTSFQPKQTNPSRQYNSTPPKLTINKSQKSPYSYVPTAIRDAVVQRKVLNTDSQSFFESSLWRKEKMICISKMRKDHTDDSTYLISRCSPRSDNDIPVDKVESIKSDETYTVDVKKDSTVEKNNYTNPDEAMTDLTDSTSPRGESLRALKDSLDRATEIVLSTTTQEDSETIVSSPSKSPENFDENTSGLLESVFEDIYELKNEGSDVEIKSIERVNDGETIFFTSEKNLDVKIDNSTEIVEYPVRRRSVVRDEKKRGSFDIARLSGLVCESIAESEIESHDDERSSSDSKSDEKTVVTLRPRSSDEIDVSKRSAIFRLCGNEKGNEKSGSNYALMIFDGKQPECHSCHPKVNLARRRSLPAALGQLRNLNNVSLGKLPIRKKGIPDNTVEDIYIDDEFGDSLNVNMVLLYGDITVEDEDFLPYLELSDSQDFS